VTVTSVPKELYDIIAEELNVKEVKEGKAVKVDTTLTDELRREGIARDLIRSVQNARKNAGFNVEDRIKLKITSDNAEITEAAKQFKDLIFKETLATGELTDEPSHSETVKLDDQEVTIFVKKV
ncbi:MAG TPA: DUF5915 domain-containing protein, partial [Nitrososphaera sp.]|nr:DUF5915 domain-containing protein [Nitrososphaera sp.]